MADTANLGGDRYLLAGNLLPQLRLLVDARLPQARTRRQHGRALRRLTTRRLRLLQLLLRLSLLRRRATHAVHRNVRRVVPVKLALQHLAHGFALPLGLGQIPFMDHAHTLQTLLLYHSDLLVLCRVRVHLSIVFCFCFVRPVQNFAAAFGRHSPSLINERKAFQFRPTLIFSILLILRQNVAKMLNLRPPSLIHCLAIFALPAGIFIVNVLVSISYRMTVSERCKKFLGGSVAGY